MSSEWDKNTVRQELNGSVLCTRLLVRTVRAMETKPERVWVPGDSKTVLTSREKHSGYFSFGPSAQWVKRASSGISAGREPSRQTFQVWEQA